MDNISFNITDWNDLEVNYDEDSEPQDVDNEYLIEIYGRTQNDKSVYLRVLNYTPFFYVEVPKLWKSSHIDKFIKYIKNKVYYKYKDGLIAYDTVKRKKLYGFRAGKRYKFVRLVFQNVTSMKKYQYMFYNKHKIIGLDNKYRSYDLYESNIPPMLRFMHIQDISACGWVEIKKSKYTKLSNDDFNTDINIEAKWTDIMSMEDEEVSKSISPLKILSFDIECTSGDGNFPQPTRKDDKVIQIGSTFSRNGSEECYYKHIITLGSCDPIEGADVESYETEQEVLLAWQKLVLREDPDIMTGYNIFGFDERYLYERSKLLGVSDEFSELGRKKDKCSKFVEKKLSSSALGDNMLRYYDAEGRVQIDLMKVVQRDYKLSSYKLDSVAEHFLTSKVISKIDDYNLEIDQIKDLSVGNFIKLIDVNGDAINDGEKFKITNIDGKIITVDKEFEGQIMKWSLAKDDVTPNDIFRLQKGSSNDRRIVAEYCIQDCALVNKLMARLCVVTNNIGMSNVCNVPLSFLFFRGQGIKIFSLVAKFCRRNNFLIPILKKSKDEGEERIGYEGATVFKPDIGFYKRPIVVNDYSSLYPSSMIHKNLSHETFVDDPKYDNHPDYIYYDAVYNNSDGTKTKCRYAKHKDGSKGLMPSILDSLLKQRKETKKLMGAEKDPFKKSIYDGLQQAYKTTANSLYGQLGSTYSQIYFKDIAASTTSTGREMLELARDYMENVFPSIVMELYEGFTENDGNKINKILDKELVQKLHTDEYKSKLKSNILKILGKCSIEPKTIYGDTDSVFIDYQLRISGKFYETKEALEFAIILGQISGDFVKSRLHPPHDLEYEKTFWPFCILSKKRYVGNKYEFDNNKFKQNSMGIVLKRRDNANIVKRVVGGMVDILLNKMDVEGAVDFVRNSIENLLKNKYPLSDFVTTKTLRGTYKNRGRMPHVCLADRMKLRDPGNAPQVNERVPYIAVVKDKNQIIKDKLEDFSICIEKLCNSYVNFKGIFKGNGLEKLFNEFKKIETTKKYVDGINDLYKKLSREVKETNDREGYLISMKKTIKYTLLDCYSPRALQGDCVEHPTYIKENKLRVDFLFYLTNQIQNPTVQFLDLLIDNPNDIFNQAINIENNRRSGNTGLSKFFKVSKVRNGKVKKKMNLSLKSKSKSKNMMKYYLNDSDEDPDKIGINYSDESEEEENISDDESVDTQKYDSLFMSLGKI